MTTKMKTKTNKINRNRDRLNVPFRWLSCIARLDTPAADIRVSRVKRIAGGKDSDENEFPFQVSLRYSDTVHICGGALISERHVLSAAHCVCELFDEPYDDLSVVTGSISVKKGGKYHKVKSIHCHPEYAFGAEDSWTHDLVVITLNDNVTVSSSQEPIDLPNSDTFENVSAILTGWGRHHSLGPLSDILQKVTLTTITNEKCQSYYNNTILPSHLCTLEHKGIGACKGDSGSPLIYNNQIIGIFSWTKPCAVGSPDVYTRVYQFIDFIRNATQYED
ncbi:PREDICTED: chymotrypsin-2-like isoform X2 [Polistes dominula]|uniref:Chymotrypsin-2-like isoform X2 n=1 Tax=Polistes dominula TaxID=743375 RepID=A0ABM1IKR3_POLDO|nr:PREDICTED: chymotrypsin-2-like isoform X2 [Polistes dominula]